jgi:thiosulfate reductase / polysulfide reductase chain A
MLSVDGLMRSHTRTKNNAWLLDVKPENPLIMHPDAAAHLGIASDDEVWVEFEVR